MTPREKFQKDKVAVSRHANLVDDPFVEDTFELALSEMVWRQPPGAMPDGVRQSDRLHGAKEFIRIWRGLSSSKMDDEVSSEERRLMFGGGLQPEDDEIPKFKPKK